jgi:hypothetical protein
MDKAKEIWGFVRRQHFWLIAPLLFIAGFVGWFLSTSKLQKEFEANQSTVQGYIASMNTVGGVQPHPNQEYLDGMQQLIDQRRENVRKAWQTKWENQKQRLRWPEGLDEGFRQTVEPMRPIESVTKAQDDVLLGVQRRQYVDFVKTELPRLANLIGARWEPTRQAGSFGGEGFRSEGRSSEGRSSEGRSSEGRSSEGSGGLEEADESQVVTWAVQNQGEFEARLVLPYEDVPPTTREILYAQEDLWVLESLVDMIKKTNGDAMTRSQASVKEIRYIKIGKEVPPPSAVGFRVIRPAPLAGEGGEGGEGGAGAEASGDAAVSGDFGGGEPPPASGDAALQTAPVDPVEQIVKMRYYDEKYEPIADLETLKANAAVAKRIPVRLMVLIDQRRINKLLVEAANAPLTFEVRQLRFNPTDTGVGAFGGMVSRAEGPGGLLGGQASRVRTLTDYQSFDRWVELFGIIYIFNPVNEGLLNGEVAPAAESGEPAA